MGSFLRSRSTPGGPISSTVLFSYSFACPSVHRCSGSWSSARRCSCSPSSLARGSRRASPRAANGPVPRPRRCGRPACDRDRADPPAPWRGRGPRRRGHPSRRRETSEHAPLAPRRGSAPRGARPPRSGAPCFRGLDVRALPRPRAPRCGARAAGRRIRARRASDRATSSATGDERRETPRARGPRGPAVMESQAPRVTVEGFDGPLDLLLELVEEKKLDILTVRLGDLADAYLARVRAMAALPADEVSAFLALASRLVLLKARSLLPSLEPIPEDEGESEEELRLRLLEYAVVRERAGQLGARLRAGERAFHREGGTIELPPRGGEVDALASAWSRVLALAARQREEDIVAPAERYSVEQRTAEIEALVAAQGQVSFATLLAGAPTVEFAVVTFIALLDLYRRGVIDLSQDELFGDIRITGRELSSAQS